jgi:HPt (histidine-containing phosphotransfer) domain-containing protein
MSEDSSITKDSSYDNPLVVLNRESIQLFYSDVCDNNQDVITELVEMYLTSLDDLLRVLLRAQDQRDAQLLRRTAHSLKSSSQIFGAEQLSVDCQTLEDIALTENSADASLLVSRILHQGKQMHELLRMEIQQL